jgi:uncharacterized membrane protein (DUF106 family)
MSDGKKKKDSDKQIKTAKNPEKISKDNSVEPAKQPQTAKKKKKSIWSTITNIIIVIGFGISFGSVLLPPVFRNTLVSIVNTVVEPLSDRVPFYIIVMIFAIVVTIFSTIIQKYTMDWEMIKRVNAKIQALSKERREAQLAGDKNKLKKLDEEQMGMADEQMQMSIQQFKPMGFIVFISIPLFWWMMWFVTTKNPNLTMTFPMMGTHKLSDVAFIFQWWIVWSIVCSFTISFVIRKALNVGMTS